MSLKISLEYISFEHKSNLPIELFGALEVAFTDFEKKGVVPGDLQVTLSEIIKRNTRLNLSVEISPWGSLATSWSPSFGSHSGVQYTQTPKQLRDALVARLHGRIDLDRVMVSGGFETIPFRIHLNQSAFRLFTAAEVTAVILHEIGHCFNALATLGDYVWLNYYLMEGIDVMLGTAKSTIKVMSIPELSKRVDRDMAVELRNNPDKVTVTKAIAQYFADEQRGHFHSVTREGAMKRDEQLADLFASRLGFGGPNATALQKMRQSRYAAKSKASSPVSPLMALGILGSVGTAVVSFSAFMLTLAGLTAGAPQYPKAPVTYDDLHNRILKLRYDGIAEASRLLKETDNGERQRELKDILASIKQFNAILDEIPKEAKNLVVALFNPKARREHHQLELERTIEDLLNNDLFVSAATLSTLK